MPCHEMNVNVSVWCVACTGPLLRSLQNSVWLTAGWTEGVLSVVSKVVRSRRDRSRSNQKSPSIELTFAAPQINDSIHQLLYLERTRGLSPIVKTVYNLMQISSDVVGLKKSLPHAYKYQRGLNRLFKTVSQGEKLVRSRSN